MPPERSIVIGSIPAITMGRAEGVISEDAKFRILPDIKSQVIPVWRMKETGEMPEEEKLNYVPKGTTVGLLARTLKKYKVQKWENHWYYVEVFDAFGWNAEKGWIFGEFIETRK